MTFLNEKNLVFNATEEKKTVMSPEGRWNGRDHESHLSHEHPKEGEGEECPGTPGSLGLGAWGNGGEADRGCFRERVSTIKLSICWQAPKQMPCLIYSE